MKKTLRDEIKDMLKTETREVMTDTIEGVKLVEKLHNDGWKTRLSTPWRVYLYRKIGG